MMKFFNFFKKSNKKKKNIEDYQPLIDLIQPKKEEPVTYKELNQYHYKRFDGDYIFKIGDKVICRSNEPDPLIVGEIESFWDNQGKWSEPIPYIKDENGKSWGIMGIIRPYSDKLCDKLIKMKPLEQWNYFVPKEYKYTEEEMVKKETAYQKRKEFLNKIK